PRAALPARDGAPSSGGPQGAPQSRTPQPQNAQLEQTGRLPQVPQTPQSPDALRPGPGGGGLIGGAASAIPSRTDVWGNQSGPQAPQQQSQQQGNQQGGYDFPRAELPGGNPQAQQQRPQAASWGNDPQQPVRRPQQEMSPLDAPRGHEEPESAGLFGSPAAPQGPGSTGQFPQPDFGAPQQAQQPQQFSQQQAPQAYQGGAQDPASTAQFPRPDFGAPQGPGSTGQFPQPDFGAPQQQPQAQQPQAYQGGQQQQFGRRPFVPQAQQQAPQAQPPAPRQRGGDDFGAPRPAEPAGRQPQQPQLQQPRRPEALPPAGGAGEGRVPLNDPLEGNWYAQQQARQADLTQTTQTPVVSQPSAPAPRPAGDPAGDGGRQNGGAAWRTSPNDELVRQAERVRKPAAGGVTTSGLPRRVPKANLVPGTAQEQAHTAGPQVSRAPDDVRGRLTNLRRGIQQGRQAGNSTTGSHHLGPNHQQER
ncbi:histidine kinase, partial [Streptomyces sp. NPDC006197]